MIAVEEDGDEIFTPMPTECTGFPMPHPPARVVPLDGFMRCEHCGLSYGPCARCDGSGRLTIYDTPTFIGQPCAPIGDEPCPACSSQGERDDAG